MALNTKGVIRFMLPENGVILDKGEGATPRVEILRLPYEVVILEYLSISNGHSMPTIVLASQLENDDIIVAMAIKTPIGWLVTPVVGRVGLVDGHIMHGSKLLSATGTDKDASFVANMSAMVVGNLIEALDCRNVSTRKIPIGPVKLSMGGVSKGYSEYHILELKVSDEAPGCRDTKTAGVSPREHLRRGHVHRFKTKEGYVKHWINSIIVNPGVGGKIFKDYRIGATA